MVSLRLPLVPTLLAACLASGCSTVEVEPFPEPLRPPKPLPAATTGVEAEPSPKEDARTGPRTTRAPGVVIQRTLAEGIADRLGEDLTGEPIRVSFHDVPLIPFINEVFGEELGMSFVVAPNLSERADLVTLKLTEPMPPSQLFATARRVLGEYGVDVRELEGGILSFAASQEIASREVPLLVSGRTLPEVPSTHRIIFQLVPLKVVGGSQIRGLLQEAFDRKDLKIVEDQQHSALDPAYRSREPDRVAAQRIGRCAAARGPLGMRHHRFERIEFTGQPCSQTVRQQAEGGVALGAVPASDLRPARGLARVGAVTCQPYGRAATVSIRRAGDSGSAQALHRATPRP